MIVIQVDNLTKHYGPKVAISDVTFNVKAGEVLGFLGPNGAGKTTTMRILTGYLPATDGTARIAGFDVFKQSLEARRCIGYLPENVPLYLEMTVQSYLSFMADIRQVPRAGKRQAIDRAMELARVSHVAGTIIGKLSKGYRQRVGLAQAILHNPPVLILDEPTVGLDPRQIIDTRDVIRGLGGEHTVILSTHILPEVSMTCSRVVIISDGRVVAEDTPENLTRRLRGSERIEIEARGPAQAVASALRAVPDVLNVSIVADGAGSAARLVADCADGKDVREHLARAVVEGGWGLLQLKNLGMSLEEVFLKLTTREDDVPGDSVDAEIDAPLEARVGASPARAGRAKQGAST
ncbi:MAG TPA: ABC transporter ATP-binding protein [Chloroflexota bacterium]|nr:ABC transporter ATP-binding protein [Chloroflexota bacterium]